MTQHIGRAYCVLRIQVGETGPTWHALSLECGLFARHIRIPFRYESQWPKIGHELSLKWRLLTAGLDQGRLRGRPEGSELIDVRQQALSEGSGRVRRRLESSIVEKSLGLSVGLLNPPHRMSEPLKKDFVESHLGTQSYVLLYLNCHDK